MTVFMAAPGTETLPVRMFLYIQDNIDPLVTSVSASVIALTIDRPDPARPFLRARPPARRQERPRALGEPMRRITTSLSSAAASSAPPSPGALRRLGKKVAVLDEGDVA